MAAYDVSQRPEILRRWAMLKTERSSWIEQWSEISRYLLPRSGRYFSSDRNRGDKRHNAIYDSTGTRALRILAAGMMAGMTSPARPWFRLSTADPDLAKFQPVKVWLADCTRLLLLVFQKSNTYRALHSYYEELGAFGTSAGIIVPDFENVLHHHALTTGEYAIATNAKGEVVTLYREFEMTVSQLVAEFGRDNVSDTVKTMFDGGKLDAWVPVIHAIEPRKDRIVSRRDGKNMAWKSCYFEAGCREDKPLREGGFSRFPAVVARWGAPGGDIYGNSPGMEALGDIKGLQHKQLRTAEVLDYRTRPPLQMPNALKNKESDTLPGGVTYYDGTTAAPGIKTLFEVNLNPQDMLEPIRDARQLINSAFSVDMFLMLASGTDTTKTATEIAERHEEKMMILGPTVERLHNEMLNPLVDGGFARLLETGLLPAPPEEMHGKPLQVEYISMLAQAQRAIATNGVDRYVSNLGAIAAFKPEILDKFDADQWADRYGDMLGVDPEIIVANDKVALIRAQRAKANQQAQAMASAEQASKTARNLGATPTTGGNAASDVLGLFSGYGSPQ